MKFERIYRGHIPCVRFLAAFIAGSTFATFFEPSRIFYGIINGCIFLAFISFLSIFLISRYAKKRLLVGLGISIFLGIFFIGWMLSWKTNPLIQQSHFSNHPSEALIGLVQEEPENAGNYLRFKLEVKKAVHHGKKTNRNGFLLVNIKVDAIDDSLEYGDVIMVRPNYRQVSPPYNPHEFDYSAYLANKDIWHSLFLEPHQYKKIAEKEGNPLVQLAISLRRKMLRKFEKYISDKNALSVASALILGDRNDMEKEVVNAFSSTGTIHVLSVSGLHVGIVFLVFSGLLYWMNAHPRLRILKTVLLVVLIWAYALITGFSTPVLRAAIMISFALIAFQFMHNGNIYNTIAASALFLLLYNPKFITDVGFQLSYLAVIAIVYLYPKVRGILFLKNKILKALWSYISLSIAAQLATFPLVIYYFHSFPSYFLPANIFVIVPATFIVYLGFALLFIPSGRGAEVLGNVLETLIEFMNSVLTEIANLPYASLKGFWLDVWQLTLVYAFLLTLIFAFTVKRKQLLYWSCASMILLLAVQLRTVVRSYTRQEIRFYNVYRNMAIAFFNHGKTILYADSLTPRSKRFQYAVAADLEAANGGTKPTILHLPSSYQSHNLIIQNNLIQFGDKRILVYTPLIKNKNSIHVDILYMRRNPRKELKAILQTIKFKRVLMDGSNSDRCIIDYVKQAENLSIPVYVLKNNFAYVW